MTKLESYLEQLKHYAKNGAVTAQAFIKAAEGTGDVSDILPEILSIADTHGIPKTALPEIAEKNASIQAHTRRRERIEKLSYISKRYAELADKATAMTDADLAKASADLHAETASLDASASARNNFFSWQDFAEKCKSYDPSKDFTPSFFAGLRFPNGTLSYIGARPGGGKSTMMINIAREALDAGRNVYLVNLEMVNRQMIANFCLSTMYAISSPAETGELNSEQNPLQKFYRLFKYEDDARETFDNLRRQALAKTESLLGKRFHLYDGSSEDYTSTISAIEIRAEESDVVLIDYIQHMKLPGGAGGSSKQRYLEIKDISNALLSFALRKNVVVISSAQFGRKEKGEDKPATLSDFREGGDIEQDAHNAIAIESDNGNRYAHILKAREGGSRFAQTELLCCFPYLYIHGTDKEYKNAQQPDMPAKKKTKSDPPKKEMTPEEREAAYRKGEY